MTRDAAGAHGRLSRAVLALRDCGPLYRNMHAARALDAGNELRDLQAQCELNSLRRQVEQLKLIRDTLATMAGTRCAIERLDAEAAALTGSAPADPARTTDGGQ